MRKGYQTWLGLALVIAGMAPLFTFPRDEFAAATFIAASCMVAAALAQGGYLKRYAPGSKSVAIGLASALALYIVFLAGNSAIAAVRPFGIGPQSESAIYGLIASKGTPLALQVAVLAADSIGFESYFRGTLQARLTPRFGVRAPFAVAALDALIHVASLNPLWVVATFIVDSGWGLTYYRTRDLTSSLVSHFVWDVAIFVVLPIG